MRVEIGIVSPRLKQSSVFGIRFLVSLDAFVMSYVNIYLYQACHLPISHVVSVQTFPEKVILGKGCSGKVDLQKSEGPEVPLLVEELISSLLENLHFTAERWEKNIEKRGHFTRP
jgi:hypothetical protein